MSETRTFTASDLRTAVAVAVKRDRARTAAILGMPEAAGREGLAQTLATTTDMSFDQVKAALAAAPVAPAAGRAGTSDIGLSVEQPAPGKDNAEASSLWDKSLASRGMQIGGAK